MSFHRLDNAFTAESQRTQRVEIFFYPAVRGGWIKDSHSASGQRSAKGLCLEEAETFAGGLSPPEQKTSSLRPLRLCGEQNID